MRYTLLFFFAFFFNIIFSQFQFEGHVLHNNLPAYQATISIKELNKTVLTDSLGFFSISIPHGEYSIRIQTFDSKPLLIHLNTKEKVKNGALYHLESNERLIEEVVVSGQLKEINKLQSIVPVEIYNPTFFKKNPTSTIYEALQNINGVRPQLNCNICNTGDIHINGLEGPYTMVLIDGMPVVSSLATVYGLSAIPNSLVERMEIIRGPSSALYGSEAIGGIINIITKSATNSPKLSADLLVNSWMEANLDLGFKTKMGEKVSGITGINYFNFTNPVDNNNDYFTDVTLQERISVFHKLNFSRKDKKDFSVAARYFYEDRWGGDMKWNSSFRGGDSIYGESIYTTRYEILAKYALPVKENIVLTSSFTQHFQNSFYGTTSFNANQRVYFAQLLWYKTVSRHDFVLGSSYRNTFYDDNTFATSNGDSLVPKNIPDRVSLPGIFFQNDWSLNEKHKILFGLRYDYSTIHKNILTPRLGYKYTISKNHLLRINAGTGYRVVSVFTEDHAALTGARKTEIAEKLKPERSMNVNLNYYGTIYFKNGSVLKLDLSPFYTYFTNKIMPDYTSDISKIIYKNVDGYAESKGISLNTEIRFSQLKIIAGGTLMSVSKTENGIRSRQMLTELFTGTWTISYSIKQFPLDIDYTGNVYSPMKLPTLGPLDPRPDQSPWWSIQNVQFTYKGFKSFELFAGIKNLLNWTPGKKIPFLIARSHDPFNKLVEYNADGSIKTSSENPNGLIFDPTYVYGPNQGIRFFAGLRYSLK